MEQQWLVTAGLATSSLIAVVANLLLLLVFCKRRGLRTVSNRFTINLLVTNLLSSLLLLPLLVVDQEIFLQNATSLSTPPQNASIPSEIFIQEEKEIVESELGHTERILISDKFKLIINESEQFENENDNASALCYFGQAVVSLVCTASIFSVLLIGIDQYFAVIHSLRYHTYIDKMKSMAMILTGWFLSLFFGIFGAIATNTDGLWHFCPKRSSSSENETLESVFVLIYFICVIAFPFVAICVIYICIYAAARNNSERMRKSTKGNTTPQIVDCYVQISNTRTPSDSQLDKNGKEEMETEQNTSNLHKVQSAPNFSNLVDTPQSQQTSPAAVKRSCSDRVSFISNLRYKISNASVFRYREESRAAKISILVIFMVLICYVPTGVAVLLNSSIIKLETPRVYNFTSLALLVQANIVSPFLFAYRNRRIRRELLKILRCLPQWSSSSLVRRSFAKPRSLSVRNNMIEEEAEKSEMGMAVQPFLHTACPIPQVIIEADKSDKSGILKRVCSGRNWPNYKKCTFITVPESCWQTDSARGSFSSASTQISTEE